VVLLSTSAFSRAGDPGTLAESPGASVVIGDQASTSGKSPASSAVRQPVKRSVNPAAAASGARAASLVAEARAVSERQGATSNQKANHEGRMSLKGPPMPVDSGELAKAKPLAGQLEASSFNLDTQDAVWASDREGASDGSLRFASDSFATDMVYSNDRLLGDDSGVGDDGSVYVGDQDSYVGDGTCDTCSDGTCDGEVCGPCMPGICGSYFAGIGCDGLSNYLCSKRTAWFSTEYLYWRAKGTFLPPIATTSANSVPQDQMGLPVAYPDTTQILIGDERAADGYRSGFRISGGYWLDMIHSDAFQADYMLLGTESDNQFTASDGSTILVRPVYDVVSGMEIAEFLGGTNLNLNSGLTTLAGWVDVTTTSRVESAGATWRHMLWMDCEPMYWYKLNMLFGYRYWNLDESLEINDYARFVDSAIVANGTVIRRHDDFDTSNEFHGGELGLTGEMHFGRFSIDMLGKVGLGNMHQILDIAGDRKVFNPGGALASVVEGGLLTQPSNIGRFTENDFAVIPEVSLKGGWQMTSNLRLSAGYSFLYVNRVLRPGESIDRGIDFTPANQANPIIGETRPRPKLSETDFYLHGLNMELEFSF
jgi:hypothetical protein